MLSSLKRRDLKMNTTRIKRIVLIAVFTLYAMLTIFPFYVLFVRSFVSTREATDLHLWIPGYYHVSERTKIWNIMEFLQLNKKDIARGIGLDNPDKLLNSMTLGEVSKQFNINYKKIQSYLGSVYRYHGWIYAAGNIEFLRSVGNSVYVTGMSLLLLIFLSILTGSVLAGFKKRWHFGVYQLYMVSLVITSTFIMVPKLLLMNMLHLTDTFWSIILPFAGGNALSTMIFTNYINTIPKELKESVFIDGGNFFHYLFRIVFPLCSTPIGAMLVIQMPIFWNNFLESMLYLTSQSKYTLQVYLRSFIGQTTDDFQALYTTVLLSIIPMLIIYIFARKLFVKTLLSGAIKG